MLKNFKIIFFESLLSFIINHYGPPKLFSFFGGGPLLKMFAHHWSKRIQHSNIYTHTTFRELLLSSSGEEKSNSFRNVVMTEYGGVFFEKMQKRGVKICSIFKNFMVQLR